MSLLMECDNWSLANDWLLFGGQLEDLGGHSMTGSTSSFLPDSFRVEPVVDNMAELVSALSYPATDILCTETGKDFYLHSGAAFL
jgi:hypothetical protein